MHTYEHYPPFGVGAGCLAQKTFTKIVYYIFFARYNLHCETRVKIWRYKKIANRVL
jgi:hypothetical protein